ncbi:MAG: RNA-guided pseudouridylation complex pseudouridine synthase subunit Cbf5 [Halobacteriota archaeon]|nr:RNA-guided pseudouridylation complex pseudouridine synthase subunit Cbf5 [Halobacteriota archaeon]
MSERNLLVKSEGDTDPLYGCSPEDRPIEEHIRKGIVILDKPSGPTSHEIDHLVKYILEIDKAGHGGTLDPKVTGVLPVMLEDSTKAALGLSGARKEYVCLMTIHANISPKLIKEVCNQFVGKIYQRPPLKSAVKRRVRIREIYYLQVLEISGKDVLMKVGCEAGTYIRKLVFDIGEVLGCGAHMAELRRTISGPFKEAEACTLHDLKDAYVFFKEDRDERLLRELILPTEAGLIELPRIFIKDTAVDAICHGANLMVPGVLSLDDKIKKNDTVAVFTLKGEAVCIGAAKMTSKEMLKAQRGLAVELKKTFMSPGIYPKRWKSPAP